MIIISILAIKTAIFNYYIYKVCVDTGAMFSFNVNRN